MRYFVLFGVALITVATFAGCGGGSPPISAPDAIARISGTSSDGYSVLHSFGGVGDGQQPKAALISVNGVLYGSTYAGGTSALGTVFSVTPAGAENVVYSFKGSNDGANPAAALLAFKGALYGTTERGGQTLNAGTVFRLQADGEGEKVLHTFGPVPDGLYPVASLIEMNGKLCGTTSQGGSAANYGIVFEISQSGKEKVLHSFINSYTDGLVPLASLLDVNDTLYGTTQSGVGFSGINAGFGTVFTVTKRGTENVLYSFPGDGANGYYPIAALINVHGTLYGTTAGGGAYGSSAYGSGTAFKITTGGELTTLHNFGFQTDGSHPAAPLLSVKGTLYGTTSSGGAFGKGTIFSMTTTGAETVLHSFGSGSDGATPLAGLLNVHGTLYGTTSAGGTQGYGTAFALRIK